MMESFKHAVLGAHCLSIKSQKENRSFRTVINMDQGPKTSTRILINYDQGLPKLQLIPIKIKWTKYALLTHMTTSVLCKIPILELILLMHIKNTL